MATTKDRPYLVRRTDNWSGMSIRATSPVEAVHRALRYHGMSGAPSYDVRPFFACTDPATGEREPLRHTVIL